MTRTTIRPTDPIRSVTIPAFRHRRRGLKAMAAFLLLAAAALPAFPQGPPFVTGLQLPTKVAFTRHRNLVVTEAGTAANNSGRISIVDRATARRRTLVEGLPSGISRAEEPGTPSGPSGVAVQDRTLYVSIGAGDAVLPGPNPGTEMANPAVASPILSSLLSLQSSVPLDIASGGFVLTPSDHATLKGGGTVTLQNADGETLAVRLLADFPDFTPEPRGDFPSNVRAANPFGVAVQGQTVFVVDASQNSVIRVDAGSGQATTLSTIGKIANPLPMGAPFIDPVPDSIQLRGGDLVVTTLTGFPFPGGSAGVLKVDRAGGAVQTLVAGLTTAIDVAPLGDGPDDPLVVLEFSTNMLQQAPGRLRLVAPGETPMTLAEGLPTPTGMAVDRVTGEIFVTHIFPGLLTRVAAGGLIPQAPPSAVVPVVASSDGAFGTSFTTAMQLSNPWPFAVAGQLVVRRAGFGVEAGPAMTYALAPFETRSVGAPVESGAGSLDVRAAVGPAPVIVTTITETSSANRLQFPSRSPADAVGAGMHATLVTPADASRERFNVGIRTLGGGATFTVRLHDSTGALVASQVHAFGPDTFQQFSFEELLGRSLASNHAVTFEVESGSLLVYGTAVDNTTGTMSLQLPTPLAE